ncbi:unnamed protein product [Musa hybrid cultivar]
MHHGLRATEHEAPVDGRRVPMDLETGEPHFVHTISIPHLSPESSSQSGSLGRLPFQCYRSKLSRSTWASSRNPALDQGT